MRTEPRRTGPGEPVSVLLGRMKSEVIIRFRSGRAEMPWGLNPSSGGVAGHSWNIDMVPKWLATKCMLAVEFGHAAGRRAVGRAHLRDQEAAVLDRQEIVGDARFHGFGGEQKPRVLRIGHVEEEDPVLPFQTG